MGVIVRNGIEYSGTGGSNVVYLTQEEYDALPDSKLTDNVEYRITDANTNKNAARNLAYDNTDSNLEAINVQAAIDEVNDSLGGLRFGTDGDGNYGYYGADDSLIPFKSGNDLEMVTSFTRKSYTLTKDYNKLFIITVASRLNLNGVRQTVTYESVSDTDLGSITIFILSNLKTGDILQAPYGTCMILE